MIGIQAHRICTSQPGLGDGIVSSSTVRYSFSEPVQSCTVGLAVSGQADLSIKGFWHDGSRGYSGLDLVWRERVMSDLLPHWFANLFRDHNREFLSYAARLVGNRDSGEDVVQTTYVKLAAHSLAGNPVSNPRAFAITALRHAAFDFVAKRHREWLYRVDCDGIEELEGCGDPVAIVEYRERILQLAILLNELPESCATAFLLNKLDGLTHREIAQRMGISISMVEKHIMRVLRHCRDTLWRS